MVRESDETEGRLELRLAPPAHQPVRTVTLNLFCALRALAVRFRCIFQVEQLEPQRIARVVSFLVEFTSHAGTVARIRDLAGSVRRTFAVPPHGRFGTVQFDVFGALD